MIQRYKLQLSTSAEEFARMVPSDAGSYVTYIEHRDHVDKLVQVTESQREETAQLRETLLAKDRAIGKLQERVRELERVSNPVGQFSLNGALAGALGGIPAADDTPPVPEGRVIEVGHICVTDDPSVQGCDPEVAIFPNAILIQFDTPDQCRWVLEHRQARHRGMRD